MTPLLSRGFLGHFDPMARPDTSFKVRMPSELRAHVEAAAQRAGRSINAEIVYRLDESFDPLRELPIERPPRRPLRLSDIGDVLAGRVVQAMKENLTAAGIGAEEADRRIAAALIPASQPKPDSATNTTATRRVKPTRKF